MKLCHLLTLTLLCLPCFISFKTIVLSRPDKLLRKASRSHCSTNYNLDFKVKPYSQKWYREKQSHLSKNQRKIIRDLFPVYGIVLNYGELVRPINLFNFTSDSRDVSNVGVNLDIGFGSGDSLLYYASMFPNDICLGVEIHKASIATVLLRNHNTSKLNNIKVIRSDIALLMKYLVDRCLDTVSVYFPDPWTNEFRDGERRVIRVSLLLELSKKMKSNGKLRIATDVSDYATHVVTTMNDLNDNINTNPNDKTSDLIEQTHRWNLTFASVHEAGKDLPPWRTVTKYELKAQDAEPPRQVYEFEYTYQVTSN